MKFIHAIVLTEEEIKSGYYDTGDWSDLSDGDYIVHALYDCELGAVAMINDNTHTDIEGHIDSFLSGFKWAGKEVEVSKALVVVNGDPYSANSVYEKISKGNYTEVND